jgi:hypothetical protein
MSTPTDAGTMALPEGGPLLHFAAVHVERFDKALSLAAAEVIYGHLVSEAAAGLHQAASISEGV